MVAVPVVTAFQDSFIGGKMLLGFKNNGMWSETRQYHSRSLKLIDFCENSFYPLILWE